MGLMDVLQGMANGPRGAQTAQPGRSGISPLAMGLLDARVQDHERRRPAGRSIWYSPDEGTAPQAKGSGGGLK